MSEQGPTGESSPLESLPFFEELKRFRDWDGPVHWDVAQRVAVWVAGGGQPEPAADPAPAAQLEELGRVAELQVAASLPPTIEQAGTSLVVAAVTRGEWAVRALNYHSSLLEALARSLAGDRPVDEDHRVAGLAPSVMEGLMFGWMMGQLSRRALGQYDPPLPRPGTSRLSIPLANLDGVAGEWGLPLDEVRLWACLQDVAHHAVLGLGHVNHTIRSSLRRYVSAFEVPPDAMAEEIDVIDAGDPASFWAALGEPEAMVAAVQTPAQAEILAQLEALAAVVEGWVDHVVGEIGRRLLPSYPSLHEAVRRRRAEATWGDRYAARLLGIGLRQSAYERGRRFISGVVDRAGEDALGRLWNSPRELPTPAEVDAPGLWLARIELVEDD